MNRRLSVQLGPKASPSRFFEQLLRTSLQMPLAQKAAQAPLKISAKAQRRNSNITGLAKKLKHEIRTLDMFNAGFCLDRDCWDDHLGLSVYHPSNRDDWQKLAGIVVIFCPCKKIDFAWPWATHAAPIGLFCFL